MDNKGKYIVCAVAWVATAAAVATGICVTGSPLCLIGLMIPLLAMPSEKK